MFPSLIPPAGPMWSSGTLSAVLPWNCTTISIASNLGSIELTMSTREEWILSQAAPTKEELYAGDGCHLDEAICLIDYLNGNITAQEAATAITKPVLQEDDPQEQLYRLMALLCEAPIELSADRDKLYDLLFAIQALPPEAGINWVDLPGFASMWCDLLRLGFDGTDTWEGESLSPDRKAELRQHFEAVGTVEAELYMRDLGGVSDIWAYEIINQGCSGRPGLDIVITGIHAWLKVAGSKLITLWRVFGNIGGAHSCS
ncbi:hypothetical protein NCS52_00313100 [Fusarium sp. LHS14.1]|nr:hypothetical protein NCS52_00313100 [Fusarium sp. LHS14.1]